MHIDLSQCVIHYNDQSKDSVNCEHTLGDKKNALFTVQRFPRGILVDWLVLLSTTILQIPFNSHSFERRTKSQHYFQNLFLWRKDAQGQLDVAQRFISSHSYVSLKQNQLRLAKQDKMHYFDFSSNWILGFSVPGAVQNSNLG